MNRNKRGIALDLKHPRGREVLLRLVEKADVLIENFRRGTLEKLGVGYDVLARTNPGLIYCAVTGYGRDGRLADKGGFDLIAQGFAGLMSITGEPGRPPVKSGNSVADINAGLLAVAGILAAYAYKLRTGLGQLVDTSLMEAALQQTYWHAAIYFATGESPGPTGSAHVLTAPYQAFRAERRLDQHRRREPGQLGAHRRRARPPGVARRSAVCDEFRTNAAYRRAHGIDERRVLATRGKAHWIAAFDAAGVPVGPVHSLGEALTHPQTMARGMVVDLIMPTGATRALGCPVHFSATPARVDRLPAPRRAHTRRTARVRLRRSRDRLADS